MRKPFIAGNWKMHKTIAEAVALVQEMRAELEGIAGCDVAVCPPFPALAAVREALAGSSIGLGAQNMHWEEQGAFTGAVSPRMLEGLCDYVIVGHSERRTLFGETDGMVNNKLQAALAHGLKPILCVGETLEQRGEGRQKTVVSMQVYRGLEGISSEAMKDVGIAYEPIWAIGTGYTATPDQAANMHEVIRNNLGGLFGDDVAEGTTVMYGGSVKPDNVDKLMAEADIDGALVGGASIDADSFSRIVKFK